MKRAAEKTLSLAIAAIALAAVLAQLVVGMKMFAPVGVLQMTWHLLGYFTILTNIGVIILLTAVGLGANIPTRLRGTFTLATTGVGLVFHLLLSHLYVFEGLAWWADLALHTLIPLAMIFWWTAFTPRHQVTWKDPFWWVCYPVLYGVYSLLRGPLNLTDAYPYPFLDPTELGYLGVAKVFVAMSIGFLIFGFAMVAFARGTDPNLAEARRQRRRKKSPGNRR